MDEIQTVSSGRGDSGDGKCSTRASNGSASPPCIGCDVDGENVYRAGQNGISGKGTQLPGPGAEILLKSTTREDDKRMTSESCSGGNGVGPEESLSRTKIIDEPHTTTGHLHSSIVPTCEHTSVDPDLPTTQAHDLAIVMENTANPAMGGPANPAMGGTDNPFKDDVMVDLPGQSSTTLPVCVKDYVTTGVTSGNLHLKNGDPLTGVNLEGQVRPVGEGSSLEGQVRPVGEGSSLEGQVRPVGEGSSLEGQVRPVGEGSSLEGQVRPVGEGCISSKCGDIEIGDGGGDMVTRIDPDQMTRGGGGDGAVVHVCGDGLEVVSSHMRCHLAGSEKTESSTQTADVKIMTLEEASEERTLDGERCQALEQFKADNNQLLERLSETCRLHEEKANAFLEATKEWESKCFSYQERVESLTQWLKEEKDRSQGHQERVKSLEHQLKEEKDRSQGHQERVKSLEHQLKEEKDRSQGHQERVKSLEHLLENERTRAQNKVAELEKTLAAKTDKITKIQLDAQSEKEDLVSRLVVMEHEKKRADDELTTADRKLKEAMKEQERLQAAIKNLNKDMTKAQSNLEKSASEHQKQLSQVREEVNSLNIKLKWAQGKLKTETEAHNDCKAQLAAMTKRYQSAKEEGEQIRADLKAMIKQYQESEEMRSNSLGMKLKKAEDELKQQEQEIADQQQLHQLTLKELDLIKSAHQITQQECQQLRSKIAELTTKVSEQKAEMDEHIISVTKLKFENKKLTTKVTGVDELNQQLESERSKVAAVTSSLSQLQQSYDHLEKEVVLNKEREKELLTFSEKLSSANAELLAEKSATEAKLSSLMEERERLSTLLQEAQNSRDTLQTELDSLTEQSQASISDLSQQLASKSEAVEQLTVSLDDEREQNNALMKKNASNLKDLQKQLQQCQKRIEQLESSNGGEAPATLPVSMASRTPSHESLDDGVVVLSSQPSIAAVQHDDDVQVHVTQNSGELFRHLDHEKEVLVERLCALKKEAAKKQEKLDFFEEHVAQLTDEVKKKSRIIQDFVAREQSGAISSPSHDSHKARRALKGGVMASVFTGKLHHNEMTFELSLEINRKMQSVLEDALLKNIMLKENIDTLGGEIARLSALLQQSQNMCR